MPIEEHEWEALSHDHIPLLRAIEDLLREAYPQAYTLEEVAAELRLVEDVEDDPDLFLRMELYVYLDILVDRGTIQSKDTGQYVDDPTTYYRATDPESTTRANQ